MNSPLDICILDPFHTGSHAAWSKGAKEALEGGGHRVTMHTLPGRHWKWRMHGAAATWMQSLRHQPPPDVVVTTDMCDVAQLRGTMPSSWRDVKVATMFHENQLTFPWSPEDPDSTNGRDNTYAFINITTALASDQVWFNSAHHRDVFLDACESWMSRMPKPHVANLRATIEPKCHVIHLGMDLSRWELHKSEQPDSSRTTPVVLWNHRWAWDKGTDAFLQFVHGILDRDLPCQFVMLGQSFEKVPAGWMDMRENMGSRCLQWGHVESREDYINWLWRADIAPVHPHQEYFGLSVVEAMRCGVVPWVPSEHAYPETMPRHHTFMPSTSWLEGIEKQRWKQWDLSPERYIENALRFDWSNQSRVLLDAVAALSKERLG